MKDIKKACRRKKAWLVAALILLPLVSVMVYAGNNTSSGKKEEPTQKQGEILLNIPDTTFRTFSSPFFSGNIHDPFGSGFGFSQTPFRPFSSPFFSGNLGNPFESAFGNFFDDSIFDFRTAFPSPLMNRTFSGNHETSFMTDFSPKITVEEKPEGFYVRVRHEQGSFLNINTQLEDGNLKLKIEREERLTEQNQGPGQPTSFSQSVSKSTVSRQVYLGENVDAINMKTDVVANGVDIFVPKRTKENS